MSASYGVPQPSGLPKATVYHIGELLNEKMGYQPGSPLEPIVEKLGGQIVFQDFWELDNASGSVCINGENDFQIFLPTHTGQFRDRFTIAHEIGHYILHYLWPKQQGVALGPLKAQRYGDGRAEYEANWFAAAFLMPKEQFSIAFDEAKGNLAVMSDRFGVSISAAQTRARVLNLKYEGQ